MAEQRAASMELALTEFTEKKNKNKINIQRILKQPFFKKLKKFNV